MKYLFILVSLFTYQSINAQQWEGYALIGGSGGSTLKLVDTNGTTVKSITCTGGGNAYANYMSPGGYFWRTVSVSTGITGGGMTGKIQKYDWDGNLLWEYTLANNTNKLHHDFHVMPNGNVLLICYDVKAAGAVTAAGGTYANAAWFEKIIEVQPTGLNTQNIVWEWNLWDHICQSTNSSLPNYVTSVVNNPQLFDIAKVTSKDFAHMNGIDFDADRNQVIFSMHYTNELYIIDHSTTTAEAAGHTGGIYGKGGDFLYRYGQTSKYNAGTAGNVVNVLHDAHLVRHGPYKDMIGFFHNKGISSSASSADWITLPRSGNNYTITPGQAYMPLSHTKRLNPNFYSSNMGNVEEFPNGNFGVCSATQGVYKEFDSLGNLLWTYTHSGSLPQVHRYTPCEISGTKPSTPEIKNNLGNLSITLGTGMTATWYYNGNEISGVNSGTYNAGTSYGLYSVLVKDKFGCKSDLSASYTYAPESISEINIYDLQLFPNPVVDMLHIKGLTPELSQATYQVIDINGRIVMADKISDKINLSSLTQGQYLFMIYNKGEIIFNKQILH